MNNNNLCSDLMKTTVEDLEKSDYYIEKIKKILLTDKIVLLGTGAYSFVFGIDSKKVIKVYKGPAFKHKYIDTEDFFDSGAFREMFMNPIMNHEKLFKYDEINYDPEIGYIQTGQKMDGISCDDEIVNNFSVNTFYQILTDITMALKHLHAHEVIHSDIKPENILYQKDANGKISFKLCDFNISQIHSSYSNSKKNIFATDSYYTDEKKSIVLDIYMFGATILRLISIHKDVDLSESLALKIDKKISLEVLHELMDVVVKVTDIRCYKILCLMMAPLEKRIYLHDLAEIIIYHKTNLCNVENTKLTQFDPVDELLLHMNDQNIEANRAAMKIIGHDHHNKTLDKQTYLMLSNEDMVDTKIISSISSTGRIYTYLTKILEQFVPDNIASFFAQQITYYPEDIDIDDWVKKYDVDIKDINQSVLKILSMNLILNYHPMVCDSCSKTY